MSFLLFHLKRLVTKNPAGTCYPFTPTSPSPVTPIAPRGPIIPQNSKLESLDLISSRPSHTCRRAARSSLPARSGPAGPDAPGPRRSLLQALSITSPTSETPVLSAATWDRLWKGSSCNRSWSKAGLGKLLGGVTRRVGAKMSQLLNSRS